MMSGADRPAVSEATIRRSIQFYEVDSAGIVHFSWFFRYMEEAEHALWRKAGLSIAPTAEIAFPRVSSTFDFRRPLRFEDEIDIRVYVSSIRSKTMKYACEVIRNGELAAEGTMTIACVSVRTGAPMRAVPFPPEIIGRFRTT
jgi:YbgC/YbaW family acyl-CoA thioester hydrolase